MQDSAENSPVARLFYLGRQSVYPGWYLQHYSNSELVTTRLEVRVDAGRSAAATEAAGFVGCAPDQVQVEGTPWPERH